MKFHKFSKRLVVSGLLSIVASTASGAGISVEPPTYFSTDYSGKISVVPGKAFWEGVTDSTGTIINTGIFGDGTVLDYRFIGVDRNDSFSLVEHANGGGSYLSALKVETPGGSGSANREMQYWWVTSPGASFSSPPDSNYGTDIDAIAGGDGITGSIDISGLTNPKIYFIYGAYRSKATIDLSMTGLDQPDLMDTLVSPADIDDGGRLVIQEVNIDNAGGRYNQVTYRYGGQRDPGRGRFGGVIIDEIPEPSTFLFLGFVGLFLLGRCRG